VHTGGAAERPGNPGRTPAKGRLLDTHGQAQDGDTRNVINARGDAETAETRRRRRRGDSGLPPSMGWPLRQSGGPLADTGATRDPRVQLGDPHGDFPPAFPSAHVDRQIQRGDGPPRMAQRLPLGVSAGRGHHRRGHHP
jgi:hypothetical protein